MCMPPGGRRLIFNSGLISNPVGRLFAFRMKQHGIPLAPGCGVHLRDEPGTSFAVGVEAVLGEGAEDHQIAHMDGVSGLTSLSLRRGTDCTPARAASTDLRTAQMRPGVGCPRWPCGRPRACCNRRAQASGTLRRATEAPGRRQSRFREIPVVCSWPNREHLVVLVQDVGIVTSKRGFAWRSPERCARTTR